MIDIQFIQTGLEFRFFKHAPDGCEKVFDLKGFGNVIASPFFYGINRFFNRREGGDHDHFYLRAQSLYFGKRIDAGFFRHHVVEKNDVKLQGAEIELY